jgi:hypothetical protein
MEGCGIGAVAQERDKFWAVLGIVENFKFLQNLEYFLSN